MSFRHVILMLLMLAAAGCVRSRYVETSSVMKCNAGECPSASHDFTYNEQRWCGFGAPR